LDISLRPSVFIPGRTPGIFEALDQYGYDFNLGRIAVLHPDINEQACLGKYRILRNEKMYLAYPILQ
jgi:hypothetical protein